MLRSSSGSMLSVVRLEFAERLRLPHHLMACLPVWKSESIALVVAAVLLIGLRQNDAGSFQIASPVLCP
jgi:hypothetical protein